jgi:hypothetical protein
MILPFRSEFAGLNDGKTLFTFLNTYIATVLLSALCSTGFAQKNIKHEARKNNRDVYALLR